MWFLNWHWNFAWSLEINEPLVSLITTENIINRNITILRFSAQIVTMPPSCLPDPDSVVVPESQTARADLVVAGRVFCDIYSSTQLPWISQRARYLVPSSTWVLFHWKGGPPNQNKFKNELFSLSFFDRGFVSC